MAVQMTVYLPKTRASLMRDMDREMGMEIDIATTWQNAATWLSAQAAYDGIELTVKEGKRLQIRGECKRIHRSLLEDLLMEGRFDGWEYAGGAV